MQQNFPDFHNAKIHGYLKMAILKESIIWETSFKNLSKSNSHFIEIVKLYFFIIHTLESYEAS